ncbi:MAG: tetratricopeptide repeat protein [Alphaproteobacteria bacterium]|nr:tetratricopeptide repeat protein [Alphaproteobacteria bacterium]
MTRLAVLWTFACMLALPQAGHAQTGKDPCWQGAVATQAKDFRKAVAEFDQCLQQPALLDTDRVKVLRFRAKGHEALGNYDAAIADLTGALELDPKHKFARNERAAIYLKQGENDKALQDLDDALDRDPGNPRTYTLRGHANAQLGNRDAAMKDFDAAIARDASFGEAYFERGMARLKFETQAAATADLVRAAELQPLDARFVESAQKQLNALGFDAGPIDGDFGPRTRAAVEAWRATQ